VRVLASEGAEDERLSGRNESVGVVKGGDETEVSVDEGDQRGIEAQTWSVSSDS